VRRFLISLALLLPQPALVLAVQDPAPVQAAAENFLRAKTRDLPGQVSISVEPPVAQNKLAPCQAFEAFQPSGARAWGRTTVGVRCVAGANWSLYLQARVKVLADYLVAAHPLAPGQPLRMEDLSSRQGDLTQLPEGTLTDPEQALGRLTSSNISQGQPLRADQLRQPPVVQQGQNVTVISRGEGFQVTTEGVAMGSASAAQVVQVRVPSGQVRSGIARPGGVVEMGY
jgi:flagella basal body P-ring formation protein FlgA